MRSRFLWILLLILGIGMLALVVRHDQGTAAGLETGDFASLIYKIALLVFIFQNLNNVRVTFLAFHGTFPLALSLLCSAVGGAVIVLLLGVARMIQLRRAARRQRNAAVAASRSTGS